jgi:hypothetical protein
MNLSRLGLCIVGVGLVGVLASNFQPAKILSSNDVSKAANTHTQESTKPLIFNSQYTTEEAFINHMMKELVERHQHEIHLVSVQVSLQDFRDFVLEEFPHNGESIFNTIIQKAFPQYASSILAMINNMDQYDAWYADNLLDLNDLDPLTKDGTIWQKRHEIFGDQAEEIWHKELQSQEFKRQTVQQTIDTLNEASNISMQERLYILKNTLDELYSQEQTNFTMNKGLVSNVYFQLESVQNDLAQLSPTDRQEAINASRKQLGFSESDITLLAQEDKAKEQRWQNGYQYMSARDQLSQSYKGDELENKLLELRKKYFNKEAPTIKAEEDSGFYRYNRPRLYGSN